MGYILKFPLGFPYNTKPLRCLLFLKALQVVLVTSLGKEPQGPFLFLFYLLQPFVHYCVVKNDHLRILWLTGDGDAQELQFSRNLG